MSVSVLTTDDLNFFKTELLNEIREILKTSADPPKRWLKSQELKELLQVSPGTLQTLRINGTLPYTKLGGIIYYDFEHIEKTMIENLRPARK